MYASEPRFVIEAAVLLGVCAVVNRTTLLVTSTSSATHRCRLTLVLGSDSSQGTTSPGVVR